MRNRKNKKGFSMMEAVISAFVLTVGILAMLLLISGSLKKSAHSRDSIIASNLAQEGIELVRNMRDNNLVNGQEAFCNDPDPLVCRRSFPADNGNAGYAIDADAGSLDGNLTPGAKRLYFKDGLYTQDSSSGPDTLTRFYRKVLQVDAGAGTDGKKFISVVTWTGNATLIGTVTSANYQVSGVCDSAKKCIYVEDILTRN